MKKGIDFWNRPLAAPGLVSYRYRGLYGWIMIGAKGTNDALKQASRSMTRRVPTIENLQVWNGTEYVPANTALKNPGRRSIHTKKFDNGE